MALEKPLLSSYQPNGLQSPPVQQQQHCFGKLNTNPVSQCYVSSINGFTANTITTLGSTHIYLRNVPDVNISMT